MIIHDFFAETGKVLALDLGGTNFRILLISLDGQEVNMESKIFLIPQSIMTGTGAQVRVPDTTFHS